MEYTKWLQSKIINIIDFLFHLISNTEVIKIVIMLHSMIFLFSPNGFVMNLYGNYKQINRIKTEIIIVQDTLVINENTLQALDNKSSDIMIELDNLYFYTNKNIYVLRDFN